MTAKKPTDTKQSPPQSSAQSSARPGSDAGGSGTSETRRSAAATTETRKQEAPTSGTPTGTSSRTSAGTGPDNTALTADRPSTSARASGRATETRDGQAAQTAAEAKKKTASDAGKAASPVTGTPAPERAPSAEAKETSPPSAGAELTASSGAFVQAHDAAEHEPEDAGAPAVESGIDAMDVMKHSRAEKKAGEPDAGKLESHVSAAQAIARAIVRDHPEPAPSPIAPTRGEAAEKMPPPVPAAPSAAERPAPDRLPAARPSGERPVVRPIPDEPRGSIGGVGAEGLAPPVVDTREVEAMLNAEHRDPFSFLGMHESPAKDALTVRVFHPGATEVAVLDAADGKPVAHLDQVHDEGLFVGAVQWRDGAFAYRLRIRTPEGERDIDDAYRFGPVLSDADARSLAKGDHLSSYRVLGAHPAEVEGVKGVAFAVWAPHAGRVAVVGEFNEWDGRRHGMRFRHECGVWEIFIPGVKSGDLYKYEIKPASGGDPLVKADPYAFAMERPPGTASIVQDVIETYRWGDSAWMEKRRKTQDLDAPLSLYEVHLGSWRRKPEEGDRWLTYRELADELVDYMSELGFTHLALLPITEHTYDDTVGYLPSDLFAPTTRYGSPNDFRYLVDRCHSAGIGVVVDWVPNFLSIEPHGLGWFDGTLLYEDPNQSRDPDWDMPLYNFGSPAVVNYLISNALYWLDQFHLDGLRIDSLAKLLYLDYGRREGEWVPNKNGGNERLEALDFIRRLNRTLHEKYPGVLTIAEDSSLRQGVTRPASEGGLGFSLRWNASWAYETLRYLKRHPVHRKYYQYELVNPVGYAFDENFLLPLSHDHVSIGQGSMINKIPGDRWQRFATLRAWMGLLFALPGKKLVFMGTEFAQDREWNSTISLDWHLLQDPMHLGFQRLVRDLNRLERDAPALYELDCEPAGFEWIDTNDDDCSVISFLRYGRDRSRPVVVVTHFTPAVRPNYRIGVPAMGYYREVLNTDAEAYGGGNWGSAGGASAEHHGIHGRDYSICVTLPPYATVVLRRDSE